MEQANQIDEVEVGGIDFAVPFLQMCVSATLPRWFDTSLFVLSITLKLQNQVTEIPTREPKSLEKLVE